MVRFDSVPGPASWATIALLITLVLPMAVSADEPLPYKLTQRWESSAGHRGEEWLVAFSKDGKLAFFDQTSGRLIARDTTTWKKTDQVLLNQKETKARQSGVSVDSPDGRYRAWAGQNYDKETRGRGTSLSWTRKQRQRSSR